MRQLRERSVIGESVVDKSTKNIQAYNSVKMMSITSCGEEKSTVVRAVSVR